MTLKGAALKNAQANWFLVLLAYLSLFVYGFFDNARGPVFPDLLRDFSLSDQAGSYFFLLASAAAMLNNVLAFRWMERHGSYWTMRVYSAVQVVGMVLIGISTSYGMVLVGAIVAGISMGGLGIAHNVLVTESVPQHLRRQALSGLHCCYGVASLLAPLYVTGLYEIGLSWKTVMIGIALGPALVVLIAETERRRARKAKQAQTVNIEPGFAPGEAVPTPPPSPRGSSRRWGAVAFFGIVMTLYVIGEISIGTRLVLFARRDAGFSVENANFLLTGYFLLLFLGRLAFAVLKIPLSSLWIMILSATLGALTYALGLVHEPWWFALTGLAISMFYPVGIAMIGDETGSDAGFITSWCITMQSLGLMAMHFLLGALADKWGLGRALWIGPACLALALVLLLAKWRFERVSLGENGFSGVGRFGL